MASLTLRTTKGSPLTFEEVDGNFNALNSELGDTAPLASPAFTGNPTAPTPATGDNDTSIATTAFVQSQKTTSNIDTTAGRLLQPGAFGLGGSLTAINNWNTHDKSLNSNLLYTTTSSTTNNPFSDWLGLISLNRSTNRVGFLGVGTFGSPLLEVGYFDGSTTQVSQAYLRNNLLGTVSQSAGIPTGAAMELGTNANGGYVRFANGLQICGRMDFSISYNSDTRLSGTWTFPAAFSTLPFIAMSFLTPAVNYTNCGFGDMGTCGVFSGGTSSAVVGINRNTSTSTFGVNAVADNVLVTAIGTWF